MIGRRAFAGLLASVGPVGPAICQRSTSLKLRQIFAGPFIPFMPGTAAGKFTSGEPSTTILAKINTGFGIVIRVDATPDDFPVPLTQITRLPPFGGKKGSVMIEMKQEAHFDAKPGQTLPRIFIFRKEGDLQAGEWSIEIWQGANKVLAQPFTIQLEQKKGT